MKTPESMLIAGKVNVKWSGNDTIFEHRKIDLKAVETAAGGRFQPEWLPILELGRVGKRQLKDQQFGAEAPSMDKV